MTVSREHEYWTPEPRFAGETVFCLASGPSLTQATVDKMRGHRSIVINSSCRLAPWADVLYFTDSSWYEQRREVVANWPGMVVSMSKTAKIELPDRVKRVKGEGDPGFPFEAFPPVGASVIRQGRSSGHTAVSLALAMGAATIVLVGYDMRPVDGLEHHHSEYTGPRDLDIYREFAVGFAGWKAAALKRGVEILNATPGSAIPEFPMVDLDEVLSCNRS